MRFLALLLMTSCGAPPSKPMRHGPVYVVLGTSAAALAPSIWKVCDEFNVQLGKTYFDSAGHEDMLAFEVLPADTELSDPSVLAFTPDTHIIEFRSTIPMLAPGGPGVLAVITHEMGHALGLSHSKDIHNIMYPEISTANLPDFPGTVSQVLEAVGVENL